MVRWTPWNHYFLPWLARISPIRLVYKFSSTCGLSNLWLNIEYWKVTFVLRSRFNLVGGKMCHEVFLPVVSKNAPQKVILKVFLEVSTCLWNPSLGGMILEAWTSALICWFRQCVGIARRCTMLWGCSTKSSVATNWCLAEMTIHERKHMEAM